jgi:hypothetical protein
MATGQLGTGAESGEQSHPRIVRGSKELRLTRWVKEAGTVLSWMGGWCSAVQREQQGCPPGFSAWLVAHAAFFTLCTRRVAAGSSHSLGLSSSGAVYSWGQGTFGALGHDDEDSCPAPRLIQRLWPLGVVQVGVM